MSVRPFYTLTGLGTRVVNYRMGWDEVKQHVSSQEYDRFGRLSDDADYYDLSLAATKKEWLTVSDFILHREFLLPIYVNENGKKYCRKEDTKFDHSRNDEKSFGGTMRSDNEKVFFSLHENDYAYALLPPIHHYLIWSVPSPLTEFEVRSLLADNYDLKEEDYEFFENPPALRSIPQIFHFQIFTNMALPFPNPKLL
jgi:hypothetical protein